MNPLALVVDVVTNLVRLIRNLIAAVLPAPEFVVLQVHGTLPERRQPRPGLLQRLLAGPMAAQPQDSLEEWRERLRVLAGDARVKGAVLKIGDLRAGPVSLESLRDALAAFRRSGKRLVAYLVTAGEGADLLSYYLASAANTIVLPESAGLWLFGPRTEATFLRGALDRIGVLPQFHHIAEYKTAANRFLHSEMPTPQREMVASLLDSVFDDLVAAIADARGTGAEAVRAAIDLGIVPAAEAKARRLVDVLAFEDEIPRLLGTPDRAARIVPWPQARSRVRRPYRFTALQRQAIGVVELLGAIATGESREFPLPLPLFGSSIAGHETIARAFRAAERSPQIKAVVFHVDSPGGSAVASDMIWREVARVQRTKPVVVYMGNVAGSGGYYVSCGARYIVAGATTLTGSIGVVSGKFNLQGLFARGGLRREVIARGETATMPSGFVPYSEIEWNRMVAWMHEVYGHFKERVASGRRKTVQEVEHIARGRVWTGRQAVTHGLVDEIGDLESAVRKAKQLAGIREDADVPVVTVRPPKVASIPAAPAAWLDMLRTAAALLEHRILLLMPENPIGP